MPKPAFYPLDSLVHGTRSDGVPIVLIRVHETLADQTGLWKATPATVLTTEPLESWQLLSNLTLTVVDGPDTGFLLATPAMARTPDGAARSEEWCDNVAANAGAVVLLVGLD